MRETMTWDDVIKAAEQAIAELALLMSRDPLHGEFYRQMMVVMMLRKQMAQGKRS